MTRPTSITNWLSLAYSEREECPPPELFLEAEWAELADDERERVSRHLASCPACAAERELAAAYDAPPIPAPDAEEAVTRLLARIDGRSDGAPVRQGPWGRRSSRWPREALMLAAAALVAVSTAVVLTYRDVPPPLPEVPVSDVARGGRVLVEAPLGDLAEPPATFSWRKLEGAASYRVTVSAVDGTVLWSASAEGDSLPLPPEVRAELAERVVYSFRVEALDAGGRRVGLSDPAPFRWAAPRAVDDDGEDRR